MIILIGNQKDLEERRQSVKRNKKYSLCDESTQLSNSSQDNISTSNSNNSQNITISTVEDSTIVSLNNCVQIIDESEAGEQAVNPPPIVPQYIASKYLKKTLIHNTISQEDIENINPISKNNNTYHYINGFRYNNFFFNPSQNPSKFHNYYCIIYYIV